MMFLVQVPRRVLLLFIERRRSGKKWGWLEILTSAVEPVKRPNGVELSGKL